MYFWLFCSITWPRVAFIFNSIVLLCFKYIQGLTETLSKNILVYESWPFKLEVSLVWSLAQRGRGRKTTLETGWQRRTTMNGFSTLFFFCFCSTAKTQSAFQFTVDRSRAASQQKSRSCHPIISVIICSIWLMWQKSSTGNNQRCSIKTLHQAPKTITKLYFFFYTQFTSVHHLSLEVDFVRMQIKFLFFFFIVHIQGTQKNYASLSVFVPSEGTEEWASTWALVRVLSADVIQCVHSCIQVRTLTFITELFISISAQHVWTWRTLLGLLLLSLLISCYICSLSM